MWSVVTRNGRKVFEGLEDAARKHISDNFPRLHVEPHGVEPTPDAVLVAPDANPDTGEGIEIFHGPETGFKPVNEPTETDDTSENNTDDDTTDKDVNE